MTQMFQPRAGRGEAAARVRQIAGQLLRELGRLPSGKEVGQAYASEGGNRGTAETIYAKEVKAELARQSDTGQGGSGPWADAQDDRLTIGPDGRVFLPLPLRQAMRLDPSGTLQAEVVDGELRLRSPAVALDQARRIVAAYSKGSGSVVDELIAERRAEAARE